jgi:hypothetical protein
MIFIDMVLSTPRLFNKTPSPIFDTILMSKTESKSFSVSSDNLNNVSTTREVLFSVDNPLNDISKSHIEFPATARLSVPLLALLRADPWLSGI